MSDIGYEIQFDMQSKHSAYWYNKSLHLLSSSKILWKASKDNNLLDSGDTYLMLMGLSFELLLKSFYVANGEKVPPHHGLDNLVSECKCEFTKKENLILRILSGYIIWQGRYPIPKEKMDKKTGENIGFHSIKDQAKYFDNTLEFSEQIAGKSNAKLQRSDLDFENLVVLWKKIQKHRL
jgi:HEPN domain-containing protein